MSKDALTDNLRGIGYPTTTAAADRIDRLEEELAATRRERDQEEEQKGEWIEVANNFRLERDAEAENCRLMQDRLTRLIEGNETLRRERDEASAKATAATRSMLEAWTERDTALALLRESAGALREVLKQRDRNVGPHDFLVHQTTVEMCVDILARLDEALR